MLVSQSLRAALILILQGLFLTRLDSEKSANRCTWLSRAKRAKAMGACGVSADVCHLDQRNVSQH